MKKMITALTLVMLITLTACSSSDTPGGDSIPSATPSATAAAVTTEPTATAEPAATESVAWEVTYNSPLLYTASGTVWLQALVEVTNIGTEPLRLGSSKYELEDDTGKLLATSKMFSAHPLIVQPGEKGYYIEETTLESVSADTAVKLIPHLEISEAKGEDVRFPVTDVAFSDGKWGVEALCRVENTTDEEQSIVYVAIMLYNADNIPIGILSTTVSGNLAANDKVGVEVSDIMMPKTIKAADVDHFTAISYPYTFQF